MLRQFRIVFKAVKSHFQRVEKRTGMGGAQLWALSVVRDQPGIGINGLAQAMDIHQSTASNLVRTLSDRGLLEVVRDDADRRAVHIRLLPEGTKALRRAPGPSTGVLPQALQTLDPATLQRLETDLEHLIDALGADRRARKTPLAQI